jgi:hypothetical protein
VIKHDLNVFNGGAHTMTCIVKLAARIPRSMLALGTSRLNKLQAPAMLIFKDIARIRA